MGDQTKCSCGLYSIAWDSGAWERPLEGPELGGGQQERYREVGGRL